MSSEAASKPWACCCYSHTASRIRARLNRFRWMKLYVLRKIEGCHGINNQRKDAFKLFLLIILSFSINLQIFYEFWQNMKFSQYSITRISCRMVQFCCRRTVNPTIYIQFLEKCIFPFCFDMLAAFSFNESPPSELADLGKGLNCSN